MAEFTLTPITADEAEGKPSIDTGVSMVGLGGHDYYCGHCGRKMMHDFDIARLAVDMAFRCGGCGNYSLRPQV